MNKILKLVGVLFAVLFIGCSSEKEIVYVDSNGSVIPQPTKYEVIDPKVVCDTRGYAYYKLKGYGSADYSLVPILYNMTYGTYQVKCKDL